jgi:hypothetical protein
MAYLTWRGAWDRLRQAVNDPDRYQVASNFALCDVVRERAEILQHQQSSGGGDSISRTKSEPDKAFSPPTSPPVSPPATKRAGDEKNRAAATSTS